jgi:hypothetical protein
VLRRTLVVVLVAALAAAVALPSSALALRVHVRVEGVKTTIFGATQPLVTPFTGSLDVGEGARIDLPKPTALGALEAASVAGEFTYRITSTSFGPYVSQIGRTPGNDESGWVYKVDGVSPPVGADAYEVKEGQDVLWYWATFGPEGGPPTLDLVRVKRGCYRAYAVDDAGKRSLTAAVFHLDGRTIRKASGKLCPGSDWYMLQATRDGAVRSQVVTN